MKARHLGLSFGLAVLSVAAPAEAQFVPGYPAVIVVPPAAQSLVNPRPRPVAPKPVPAVPLLPPPATPDLSNCHFQGQTRICG